MMHNPPHPGIFLSETVIKPLELGVTETAQRLGMSRTALSRVLNGKAGIRPRFSRSIRTCRSKQCALLD